MKTKITIKIFSRAVVMALLLLFGYNVKAQTHVYNESTSSGMFFQGNGAEVSNPLSDAVNSSANVAQSGTGGSWQQIQYFPTFTPSTGDKLFFSIYDPNNAGTAQVKFEYTSNPGVWVDGGDVGYASGTNTGWKEQSISLDANAGNEINKIILMPGYNTSNAVYVDNIYFHSESIMSPASSPTIVYDETTSSGMFFESPNGGEVSNPLSDAVNSSANCAYSGTTDPFPWLEIQYFPSYTPVAGDKLFFSVYNPNSASGAQIQFNDGAYFGGNVTYSGTGWQEYSITLDDEIGNTLTKIILYPDSGNPVGVYIDNIYFAQNSVLAPAENPIVYDESTSSGMFFESPNGGEVSNPLSDAVNSSANCAYSGTTDPFPWLEIQYFPSYTPVAGDKLFFSVYNPNSATGAQIQFNDGAYFGGNVTYSGTGWQEYSIALDDEIGNTLTKIILYPDSGNPVGVYVDNIYFGTSSTLSTNPIAKISNKAFVSKEGNIQFSKVQTNTLLKVYDLMGRLILEEKINGKKGDKVLNNKGIYILRVESVNGVSSQKIAFY
jgi:hypothetical protein